MHNREQKLKALGDILDTLDILRVKCPWDAKQTNESLRPNTIEEVYELCQALLDEDNPNICKELGDVLLHVLFYAKIGEEKQAFDIADVCDQLNKKLIFRHPHIFGDVVAKDAHEVEMNWEQIKLKEKDGNHAVLKGVPRALPALVKAFRIQEKAANAGFDWEQAADVWEKVKEEEYEVEAELKAATPDPDKIEEEFGDLLFSVINAARLYKVNPENALERTNRKFISRFNYIEEQAHIQGLKINQLTLDQMEALWQQAKSATNDK